MISSTSNSHMKDIRHLRDRKYRSQTGLSYIEGIRIVFEAIEQKADIVEVLYSPEMAKSEILQETIDKSISSGISITEVSSLVFESLSSKDGPQGIAAVIKQKWVSVDSIDVNNGFWIALYEIADPGNLGTIMRTCDAVGAEGLILIGNCTDPYDPSAVRASMGGIFTTKLCKLSAEEFVKWVREKEIKVIGSSDKADNDYRKARYGNGIMLLMGSERQGIPDFLSKACDQMVSIPMKGNCDSLNLSVATSILMYEVLRNIEEK